MLSRIVMTICLFGGAAVAQQQAWGQCGGISWAGATTCVSGYYCSVINDYYYQCVPGTASTISASSTATTSPGPTTSSSSTLSTVTKTTTGGGGAGGSYPTTLQSGYYWVRAVASPNFHSYLQAAPTATPSPGPGDAYLKSPKGGAAGQFNVISGQLVYSNPSTGTPLYMWVENVADKTQRTLRTWFDTTKNPYGTFAFQGDTLTWTVSDITRPNAAAWLVCGTNGQLYINTGAYAYNTPQGCADQTIHYYGGSTPDI